LHNPDHIISFHERVDGFYSPNITEKFGAHNLSIKRIFVNFIDTVLFTTTAKYCDTNDSNRRIILFQSHDLQLLEFRFLCDLPEIHLNRTKKFEEL
jgi:hypothetical protein